MTDIVVEYYKGQGTFTICKEVNNGGDMKTLTFRVDTLESLIQRLQDIRYNVQSHALEKSRQDRLDKLT